MNPKKRSHESESEEEEDEDVEFWSFSSDGDADEEVFEDYNHVSLVEIMRTAHERVLRPALRSKEFHCRSVVTSLNELPKLNLEDENVREQVQDLESPGLHGEPRVVKVGKQLTMEEKQEYATLFTEFGHVFIGDSQELPQIILNEHKIELRETARPKVHKLQRTKPEHMQAVREEVEKLLKQGCIVPVDNAEWVAPLVIVLKKNGKVRVCVDYRELNKATIKNRYPLPFIDCILDAVAGHEFFSFCGKYAGFHQIPMRKSDILKTTFVTPWGTYCYLVMPFGLEGGPSTYQETADVVFKGWTLSAFLLMILLFSVLGLIMWDV